MTLVFLDHSFHQKTRSTFFLRDAFTDAGWTVIDVWDDSWQGGSGAAASDVCVHHPDLVVSFQVLKSAEFYHQCGCRNVLLVPMYDSSQGMKPWDWWEYRHFGFLHFSSALHRRLARLGVAGACLQFFPDPAASVCRPWADRTGSVFYWQRVESLPPSAVVGVLRRLLGPGPYPFHWHHAADPGEAPDRVSSPELALTETHWFADPGELQTILSYQKIFIAPRLAEGIGMSFLEAMAMGCVVVAQDAPTMNEYLRHGESGVLVDWRRPDQANLETLDLEKIGVKARQAVVEGYPRFQAELNALVREWGAWTTQPRRLTPMAVFAAGLFFLRHRILRPMKGLFTRKGA